MVPPRSAFWSEKKERSERKERNEMLKRIHPDPDKSSPCDYGYGVTKAKHP